MRNLRSRKGLKRIKEDNARGRLLRGAIVATPILHSQKNNSCEILIRTQFLRSLNSNTQILKKLRIMN